MVEQFRNQAEFSVSADRLWEWHVSQGAFERLAPPWMPMRFDGATHFPGENGDVAFAVRSFGVWLPWRARIEAVQEPHSFTDKQIAGPFREWTHLHTIAESESGGSVLTDDVRYRLPAVGAWNPWARRFARNEIERLFSFRNRRMQADLSRYPERPGVGMTVLLTGASGLIGRRLRPFLQTLGYSVRILERRSSENGSFGWAFKDDTFSGVDVVIHLAGAPIAEGRWTAARKRSILQSRVLGTRALVEAIRRSAERPRVFVCSSGVNYYDMDGAEKTERSGRGKGFLAEVCDAWEAEARSVERLGVRSVQLRTGVVLDPSGGALKKMLPAFKAGLGGPIGTGTQGFPWISMDDFLDVVYHTMANERLAGPVNAVHSQRIQQRQFAKELGSVLRRPAVLPLPMAAVKVLFGEMGTETLLADLNIRPAVLEDSGFTFRFRDLEAALSLQLGRL